MSAGTTSSPHDAPSLAVGGAMSAFEELGVSPELIRACDGLGWKLPTPVQAEAVPLILGGGDVMVAAETGSGKTGAFALPVLQIVHEAISSEARASASRRDSSAPTAAASAPAAVVMSVEDRDPLLAVSADGLVCQARSERAWAGVRATAGASSGRHYYEVRLHDDGLVRIGWSTAAASRELGTDSHGFGYGGTGMKSHAKAFTPYGRNFGAGDVVGAALDADAGEVSFTLNGAPLGTAFALPPHVRGNALFPALCLKNSEAAVNFGGAPFAHPPPSGFAALAAAQQLVRPADSAASSLRGGSGERRTPRAIVLEPARDLAEQTAAAFASLGVHLVSPAVSCALCVGGIDQGPALKALRDGCDIVTGTPARVLDLVQSGTLDMSAARFLILDEADRLLETGSADAIMTLFRRFPRSAATQGGAHRLQVLLFSATLHALSVQSFAETLCDRPTWVDLKGRDFVPDSVHHVLLRCDPAAERWDALSPIAGVDNAHAHDPPARPGEPLTAEAASAAVKRLKPHLLLRLIDKLRMQQVLVFCRTNFDCDNLEAFLVAAGGGKHGRLGAESGKENPYSCCVLAGARSMEERRRNLQAFKEGGVRVLICTDVAARGIDVSGLPFVVNLTLPDNEEDYIHRVGRVGRADTLGLAVSIVSTVPERVWYCRRKGYTPWSAPSVADVSEHTVWYDEPALLTAVETRLGASISALGSECELPQHLTAQMAGVEAYGKSRAEGGDAAVAASAAHLAPDVAALSNLEHAVQRAYWQLKRKYDDAAAASGV